MNKMTSRNEIDILKFTKDLQETYFRYIYTTNQISSQEPELQKAFYEKISTEFQLMNGPFIHCTPCYKPSFSLNELISGKSDISLSPQMAKFPTDQFDPNRPLYTHQVEALRILGRGENLVVATGTGSGKTECFLLPILDDILSSPEVGLRAIFIYPMNALADDQLRRLRELLVNLPEITFGRYTGDTLESDKKGERLKEAPPNERFFRQEIRQSPPHILLTNFAMLEYLLLRPRDADIFSSNKLKFIVLDEAHSYSGAQGIEIALLMRRLKEYLLKDKKTLQFVLTSATLGDSDDAIKNVCKFGSDISGLRFKESNVLTGETIHGFAKELLPFPDTKTLLSIAKDEADFESWTEAIDKPQALIKRLSSVGIDCHDTKNRSSAQILYDLFSLSEPLSKIHQSCLKKPASFEELCDLLNIPDDAHRAIQWLITMGAFAKRSPDSAPLLPTRFHFFARGMSGAKICLNPECSGRDDTSENIWSRFYLEDRNHCEYCQSRVLTLMTCVHCGLPACRIYVSDGKWQSSKPPNKTYDTVLLVWRPDLIEINDEIDEESENKAWLCLNCGNYSEDEKKPNCCSDQRAVNLNILNASDNEGNLKTCLCCGSGSGKFSSVLKDFLTGENAPTAVLAETLIRHLPFDELDDSLSEKPAHGRKLLVFSDARQRAAFFAPYLEQTTLVTAYMNPLLESIISAETREGRPVTFEEVASEYLRNLSKLHMAVLKNDKYESEYYSLIPIKKLRSEAKTKIKREIEILLYQDFSSSNRKRTTLPGMGLASLSFDVNEEEREIFPKKLPEIFVFGEQTGWEIIYGLLQIFILRQAIDLPDSIRINDILRQGPKAATFHLELSASKDGRRINRWNPYLVSKNQTEKQREYYININRQLDLLSRLLKLNKITCQDELSSLMTLIWDLFKDTFLIETESWPGEFRLNRSTIQVTTKNRWGKCDKCGHVTPFANINFCMIPGCRGNVLNINKDEHQVLLDNNHYCHRYFIPPLMIKVKEHTAQLSSDLGKKYQSEFMKGEINVLSSSTTFEMGVDVGDLKAVLLRNIPPTTSSYIQRTGRAGRRRDGVSVALSFCGNTPHNQYHYQRPEKIIMGKVPSPYLNLRNEPLTQRHCNSLLLGYYLRSIRDTDCETLDRLTINDFFLLESNDETLVKGFGKWLEDDKNRSEMVQSLSGIIPKENSIDPEIAISMSISRLLTDTDSIYNVEVLGTEQQYNNQYQDIVSQLEDSIKISNINLTGRLNRSRGSLKRLIDQFKENRLIDFLSSCSWLPGYAFPQDVVKLLVRNVEFTKRMRLERAREIGISEYAPGAQIVADGNLFTSAGIWFNSREPEIKQYTSCQQCRKISTKHETERLSKNCEACNAKLERLPRPYIKPDGFQTSVNDFPDHPGLSRKTSARTSEVFLLDGANPENFHEHKIKGVFFAEKAGGRLFLANKGFDNQGYYVCRTCGRGYAKKNPPNHESPWGTNCRGRFDRLDLAHEFSTDILQLRFHDCNPKAPRIADRTFWLSLVSSFLNGACDALDIDFSDLGGTYHGWTDESTIGELVIYDKIPGGAGHIRRIIEHLEMVLEASLARVRDCKCPDPEASCYACLRNYNNQYYWESLKKKPVIDWLSELLK